MALATKHTEAYLGGSNVVIVKASGGALNGYQGLAVVATSSEKLFGLVAAVGGGFVGVAGAVGVDLLHITTLAHVDSGTHVNYQWSTGAISGVDSSQSVVVSAADTFNSLTFAGGAGFGFVGAAGGVDVGVADITVQAGLHSGTDISAAHDVTVSANGNKHVQTYAISIGIGAVGVAGAVSVWTVGTQAVGTYDESGGQGTASPWSNTKADYRNGDLVTFNGHKWGATVDNPTAGIDPQTSAGSGTPQWHQVDQNPMGNGSDSAQSNADFAASGNDTGGGDPGWKGIIGPTTAPTTDPSTPWVSGTVYAQNAVVTFNGRHYAANKKTPTANKSIDPATNITDWTSRASTRRRGRAASPTRRTTWSPSTACGTALRSCH